MLLNTKTVMHKSVFVITCGLLLMACKGDAPKDQAVKSEHTNSTDSIITIDTGVTSSALPSPLQIAYIFKKSGIIFKAGVTNHLKDPSKYVTNLNKALNLGVYSADLLYAILNKQQQEAIEYMKLSRQIADNLGIGAIYKKNQLLKRFEKNIGKEDSLAVIISELQMISDMYLNENNQKQISLIVFAGAWIESMHIALKVSEAGKKNIINQAFSEQIRILGSIIELLKVEVKKDPNISKLIADLQIIQKEYEYSSSFKNELKDTTLVYKEIILTNEEVASISKKIAQLRTKIINGL